MSRYAVIFCFLLMACDESIANPRFDADYKPRLPEGVYMGPLGRYPSFNELFQLIKEACRKKDASIGYRPTYYCKVNDEEITANVFEDGITDGSVYNALAIGTYRKDRRNFGPFSIQLGYGLGVYAQYSLLVGYKQRDQECSFKAASGGFELGLVPFPEFGLEWVCPPHPSRTELIDLRTGAVYLVAGNLANKVPITRRESWSYNHSLIPDYYRFSDPILDQLKARLLSGEE